MSKRFDATVGRYIERMEAQRDTVVNLPAIG